MQVRYAPLIKIIRHRLRPNELEGVIVEQRENDGTCVPERSERTKNQRVLFFLVVDLIKLQ